MTEENIDKRWLEKYEKAKEYYEEFENIDVPLRYIAKDGFQLGQWIGHQRKRYKKDLLNSEEINYLEKINIKWEIKNVASQTSFPEMAIYFYFNKALNNVATRHLLDTYEFDIFLFDYNIAIEYDGVLWHKNENKKEIDINKNKYCSDNNIKILRVREYGLDKLSENDFILNDKNNNIEEAISYLFGVCNIENIEINLKDNSKEIYDLIKTSNNWINNYNLIEDYYKINKNIDIPAIFIYNGKDIGNWLHIQRRLYKKNLLSTDKIKKLEKLCIDWTPNNTNWNKYYDEVKEYYNHNGNIEIPYNYIQNKLNLNSWLSNQKYLQRNGCLSKERLLKLEVLKIDWDKKDINSDKWNNSYNLCKEYLKNNNKITRSTIHKGIPIGEWAANQKKKYKNFLNGKIVKKLGKLTIEQISLLKELKII